MFKDRFLKNSLINPTTANNVTSSIASIGETFPRDVRPDRSTQKNFFNIPKMFLPPEEIRRTRLIKSNQIVSDFITPTVTGRMSFFGGVLQSSDLEVVEETLGVFDDVKIESSITYTIDNKTFGRRGMDFNLSSSRVVEDYDYDNTEDGAIRFNFVAYNYNSKTPNKNISCDLGIGQTDVVVNFHKAIHDQQSHVEKFEFLNPAKSILIDRQLNSPVQKNKEVTGEQIYFDDLRVTIKNNIQKERITWDYVLGDEIYPSSGDPFSKRIRNSIAFRSF